LAREEPLHPVRHERRGEGHVAAGDGGAARPAVGLEDVAVHRDRLLAEARQIDDAPERATDEPLDLVGPPAESALDGLTLGSLGGRTREHRVLRGDPAGALASKMGWHAI